MLNPETRTLEQMFEFQKQLQLAHNRHLKAVPFDDPELCWTHISAAMYELAEAVQEDNRWKTLITDGKIKVRYDREAKLEELTDAMHYLINAVLLSGCDIQEFVDTYVRKNKTLIERAEKVCHT